MEMDGFTPTICDSVSAILETHDKAVAEFEKVLKAAPDEEYAKTWTMKFSSSWD